MAVAKRTRKAAQPSPIEGMLEELREDGPSDSGYFTLDPKLALEKLSKFQLESPFHYVLLLTSALLERGPSFVECRHHLRDLRLFADVPVPTPSALELLIPSLFSPGADPHDRSLALGLNSARSLRPAHLSLDFWSPDGGHSLVLIGDEFQVRTGRTCPWPSAPPGTTVCLHLRHRLGWASVRALVGGLLKASPEERAVRALFTYAGVPVRSGGSLVNPELDLGRPLVLADIPGTHPAERVRWRCSSSLAEHRPARSPGYAAVLALYEAPPELRVQLVCKGLGLGQMRFDLPYAQVTGVVSCSGLELDASGTRLVHGPTYQKLLRQLRTDINDMLIALARQARTLGYEELEPAIPVLLRAIGHLIRAREYSPRWRHLKQELIDVPLFRLHDNRPVSLRPLLDQFRDQGQIPTTTRWWGQVSLDWMRVVYAGEPFAAVLRRVFGRLDNGEALLLEAQARCENRAGFLQVPTGLTAIEGCLVQMELSHPSVQGTVGLLADPDSHYCVRFHRELRPLGRWQGGRRLLPFGVVASVNHDGLLSNADWTAVIASPASDLVMAVISESLGRLYSLLLTAPLPEPQRRTHLWNLLDFLSRRNQNVSALPGALREYPLIESTQGALSLNQLEDINAYYSETPVEAAGTTVVWMAPERRSVVQKLLRRQLAAWNLSAQVAPAPAGPILHELRWRNPGDLEGNLRFRGSGGTGVVLSVLQGEEVVFRHEFDWPIPKVEAWVWSERLGEAKSWGQTLGPGLTPTGATWVWLQRRLKSLVNKLTHSYLRHQTRSGSCLEGRFGDWIATHGTTALRRDFETLASRSEVSTPSAPPGAATPADGEPTGPAPDLEPAPEPVNWDESVPPPGEADGPESSWGQAQALHSLLERMAGPALRLQVSLGFDGEIEGLARWTGERLLVNPGHPLVRRAETEPSVTAMLARALFSLHQRGLEIEEPDLEREFHRRLLNEVG